MASFNKVILMGNLTRNPELRYTPGGSAVAEFGMAVNRRFTVNGEQREETCFVDINVWGKQAESVNRYLEKGSPVFVEGRLQFDTWEDKNTGGQRSRLRVVGERVQFIGSPKRGAPDDDNAPAYSDQGRRDNSSSRAVAAPAQARPEPMPSPVPGEDVYPSGAPEDSFNTDDSSEDDVPF